MADIFEEVEEGLRQDRFSSLWKRYGIFAYLGAVILIGAVALNEYLQVRGNQTTQANAARVEAALTEVEARNYEVAAAQLSDIVADDIAPSNIAAHFLAGVRLDGNGDAVAAADVLQTAAGGAEDPTEKLALIKAAYLRADTLDRAGLQAFLAPLNDDDGPFGALAKEVLAAKALQEGDVAFARREFGFLRFVQNAPPGVVTRAEQALAALPPLTPEELNAESVEPSQTVEDAADATVTDADLPNDASTESEIDTSERPEETLQ
ncbi:MAG: hypothetical protein AAGL90_06675 [Pseudomonadota bacterium]